MATYRLAASGDEKRIHLRLAIVISQHRSLRKAADAINIRQSTLSRRLRDLEYRLDAVCSSAQTGGLDLLLQDKSFLSLPVPSLRIPRPRAESRSGWKTEALNCEATTCVRQANSRPAGFRCGVRFNTTGTMTGVSLLAGKA